MIDDQPPRARRFGLEAAAYGLGSAATAIVSIIAVPILTRLLDPSSFGSLDLFSTLLSIMTVVAQLGLASALVIFYRRAEAGDVRRDTANSGLAIAAMASGALGALGAVGFAVVSATLHVTAVVAVSGFLTCLWLPVNVIGSTAQDLLRAQFRARAFAILSVTRAAAATLLGIVLVAGFHLDIAGVIGAQVIVGAVFTIVTLALVRGDLRGSWNGDQARRMLAFGIPLVPAGIAAWVLVFGNRFFLLRFTSLEEVGIYAVAARVAAVMTIATVALNSAWLPFAVQEASLAGHRVTYARMSILVAAGLLIVASGLGLVAPEILGVVAPASYGRAADIVGLLAIGIAANALAGLVGIGLQLTERTERVAAAAGLAAAVNVVLNLVLVPATGAVGAATATLVALALQLGLTMWMAQRLYRVPYPTGSFVVFFGVATAALVAGLAGTAAVGGGVAGLALRLGLLAVDCVVIAAVAVRAVRSLPSVA